MALQRGPDFYARTTVTDAPPAGVYDLSDASAGAAPTLTSAVMTSNVGLNSAAVTYQLVPGGTTTVAVRQSATVQEANNKGWEIPRLSGVGSTTADQRQVGAVPETNTLNLSVTNSLGVGNATVTWALYRREANGTLTFLSSLPSQALLLTVPTTATATNTGANSLYVFPAGTSLYIEVYVTIPGQLAVATTITASLSLPLYTLGAPYGIGYLHNRSQATLGQGVVVRGPLTIGKVALILGSSAVRVGRLISKNILIAAVALTAVTKQINLVKRVVGVASTLLTVGLTQAELARLANNPDYPVANPTRAVAGVVYDEDTGTTIAGATVNLLRESDGKIVQTATSSGVGAYTFPRDTLDPYTYLVIVTWTDAQGGKRHGTSDPGQAPA